MCTCSWAIWWLQRTGNHCGELLDISRHIEFIGFTEWLRCELCRRCRSWSSNNQYQFIVDQKWILENLERMAIYSTIQQQTAVNMKYKKKLKKLKKFIENLVFVSVSICIHCILNLKYWFLIWFSCFFFVSGECSIMRSSISSSREYCYSERRTSFSVKAAHGSRSWFG